MQQSQNKLAKAEAEIDRLRNVENYLKEQSRTLENVIIDKTKTMDQLQRDLDAMRLASEERVVHFQMQLNQSKKLEEQRSLELQAAKLELEKVASKVNSLANVKEEKEMLLESNKEMIVALQARLIEVEPEIAQLRDKVKDHERRYSALQLMKAEQDKVLTNTQNEVKTIVAERDELQQKIREMDEHRIKAEGQSLKMNSLSEEVNKLKEELEEKSAIIMRLRSEAQTSERNHAMRTAMLATCEAQLETLQKDLQAKDDTNKEALERVSSLQIKLAALEARLEERTQEANLQIEALQRELQQEHESHRALLKAKEQEAHEQLDTVKKEYGKKAGMARQLLAEREEEVRVLSSKVKEMQEEIASGAPTDRKLLEFAQAQSRRDALNGVHRDTREVAFQQLQVKLATKDYELAQTQQSLHQLMQEVLELRKIKQREGINMDYLKNVILQYMIFPVASSERMALIPVIAMLLQFSPKEMQDVNQAIRDPNFGARAVKEVKRIDGNARMSGSSSHGGSSKSLSSSSSHGGEGLNGASSHGMDKSSHGISNSASSSQRLSPARSTPSVPPTAASSSLMQEDETVFGAASPTTPAVTASVGSGRPPRDVAAQQGGYVPPSFPSTSSKAATSSTVQPSLSDQDLQEKLRRISGDILDLSTMSQEDIDQYLANLTPSTEESRSPQNNKHHG